jgi:hypothetical protein
MSLAVIGAWLAANEGLVATILLLVSEALGANPKFKSNGILSFVLVHIQDQLKKRGGKDLTP